MTRSVSSISLRCEKACHPKTILDSQLGGSVFTDLAGDSDGQACTTNRSFKRGVLNILDRAILEETGSS